MPEPLPDPVIEPTISVPRAGRLLGVARHAAYAAAARGDIPVIRLGPKRIVVPTAKLLRLLGIESRPSALTVARPPPFTREDVEATAARTDAAAHEEDEP